MDRSVLKRKHIDDNDETIVTPKKARRSHATPGAVQTVATPIPTSRDLPQHLARLLKIYVALEQCMSSKLAISHKAPDPDNGRLPAVLNHLEIAERGMGGMQMDVDDLRRLCWVWEWDLDAEDETPSTQETEPDLSQRATRTRVHSDTSMLRVDCTKEQENEDDGPFLDRPTQVKEGKAQSKETPKNWIRGGSGFIITPTMHAQYEIGIEVDWAQEDVAGGRVGGTSAVTRWIAAGEMRKRAFKEKLERWVEVHSSPASVLPIKSKIIGVTPLEADSSIPVILLADLSAPNPLKLTKLLVSKEPARARSLSSATPSLVKTTLSNKDNSSPLKKSAEGFMMPLPGAPGLRSIASSGSNAPFTSLPRSGGIHTPSFGCAAVAKAAAGTAPSSRKTKIAGGTARVAPQFSPRKPIGPISKTPTNQKGNNSETASVSGTNWKSTPSTGTAGPETATNARRRALYARIRGKSEPRSDATEFPSAELITHEEPRRRCILGRLDNVAETVWMLFASPPNSTLISAGRKAIQQDEVVQGVVRSAGASISDAEAVESVEMLCELCPFFLKRTVISGEDWLKMPTGVIRSPGKVRTSEEELLARDPKRIRNEGGLRQVRDIIRKKLEVDGDDD